MATKHEQIIHYIESLPIGEKISVRSIAKNLKMSEGTAYRAIKDAENIGIVSTIERVGTIRIERKNKRNFEHLTYEALLQVIEGRVMGGAAGLTRTLNKFIIGAMQEEAMQRYLAPDALMIVGNREQVQRLALEQGAAVLITGGFEPSPAIISLANQVQMPILSTSYDTFTVATLINRAMSDQLIKKEIILVDNIYTKLQETSYLTVDDTVATYRHYGAQSDHSRFPVVNGNGRLVGMVTAKDVINKSDQLTIERVMTRSPLVAKTHMSVASVSHMMIWDGLEILPVVEDNMQLIGIVSRRDVMKAMQLAQRQPQIGNTIEDQIIEGIEVIQAAEDDKTPVYRFKVQPQMLNNVGTISYGVLAELIANSAQKLIYAVQKKTVILEQLQLHYFKMIQNDNIIELKGTIFDTNRRVSKVDIEVFNENTLVAKAIVTCQLMERS